MKQKIVIVDPFFSGANYPNVAKQLNYDVIGIQSSPTTELPPIAQSLAEYYIFDHNLDELLTLLRAQQVAAVFAGCENGVILADILAEKLGLIGNGTHFSLTRRDKGAMKKQFNNHGVPCAKFMELERLDVNDILEWMSTAQLNFPIVLKPAMAFGSINVFICENLADLIKAVAQLAHQDLTDYGIDNNKILAEEYLDGDEYCIDLLGDGSEYFITDVWQYDRREQIKGRLYCYSADIIDPLHHPARFSAITTAAIQAARALEILYGCAHVELKINNNNQIKILEVGARIVGAHFAELAKMVTNQDIELATIQAFLGLPVQLKTCYSLHQQASTVLLVSKATGTVKSISGLGQIKQLPSFEKLYLHINPGSPILKTVDIVTSPGLVQLRSSDKLQIARDKNYCHEIFDLEIV